MFFFPLFGQFHFFRLGLHFLLLYPGVYIFIKFKFPPYPLSKIISFSSGSMKIYPFFPVFFTFFPVFFTSSPLITFFPQPTKKSYFWQNEKYRHLPWSPRGSALALVSWTSSRRTVSSTVSWFLASVCGQLSSKKWEIALIFHIGVRQGFIMYIQRNSVSDSFHFDSDPDPAQNPTRKNINSCFTFFFL